MPKKLILFITGTFLLITGITLVLKEWEYVVGFFKGVGGMALAVVGLVVLMFIKSD